MINYLLPKLASGLEDKVLDRFELGDDKDVKDDGLFSLWDCVEEVLSGLISLKRFWILVEFFWLAYSRGSNPSLFWWKRLIPKAISFLTLLKSFFS